MKYVCLTLLLLFLTVAASAQTLSDSSGVEVLQKNWRKGSKSSSISIADEDPFRAINNTRQATQDREADMRDRASRQQQGLPPEQSRANTGTTIIPKTPERSQSSGFYIYQIKVKNNGTKTIESIGWEYVFLSPTTNKEVGNLKFLSETNLKPGKTDNLVMSSPNPPTLIIQADDEDKYIEQIFIKTIKYNDGSVWTADLD